MWTEIGFWLLLIAATFGAYIDWKSSLGFQYWGGTEDNSRMADKSGNFAEKLSFLRFPLVIGVPLLVRFVFMQNDERGYLVPFMVAWAIIAGGFFAFHGFTNIKNKKAAMERQTLFLTRIANGEENPDYKFNRNSRKLLYSWYVPFFKTNNPDEIAARDLTKRRIATLAKEPKDRWTNPGTMEKIAVEVNDYPLH